MDNDIAKIHQRCFNNARESQDAELAEMAIAYNRALLAAGECVSTVFSEQCNAMNAVRELMLGSETHRSAHFYRGRDVGRMSERNKQDRIIESLGELVKKWRARARSAEGTVRKMQERLATNPADDPCVERLARLVKCQNRGYSGAIERIAAALYKERVGLDAQLGFFGESIPEQVRDHYRFEAVVMIETSEKLGLKFDDR